MGRLHYNGLTATLGSSGLDSTSTTITFAASLTHVGGAVPTVAGNDHIALSIMDAQGRLAEIVHLTGYTSGQATGTVVRAKGGSVAKAHAAGAKVINAVVVSDVAPDWLPISSEDMNTNTRWTAASGTWEFGAGSPGVKQTNTATSDAWLRPTTTPAQWPSDALRGIRASVKSDSGWVGFGFSANGGWATGSLGIGLNPSNNTLWYDRFGSGGSTIALTGLTSGAFVDFAVYEMVQGRTFHVLLNGARVAVLDIPSLVLPGVAGLYCRSGSGTWRDVRTWGATIETTYPVG